MLTQMHGPAAVMTAAELPLTLEDIEAAVAAKVAPIAIREGNWDDYLSHVANCGSGRIIDAYGSVIAYKRICAYAYLGSRSTMSGSLYVRAQPRTFTVEAISALRAANDDARRRRYPLLEQEVAEALAQSSSPVPQAGRAGNVVSLLRATLAAPVRLVEMSTAGAMP